MLFRDGSLACAGFLALQNVRLRKSQDLVLLLVLLLVSRTPARSECRRIEYEYEYEYHFIEYENEYDFIEYEYHFIEYENGAMNTVAVHVRIKPKRVVVPGSR